MLLALSIITVILLLITILPVWRTPHWIIRGMEFPRLQLAVLAAVLILAEFMLLDFEKTASWGLIGVTIFCLVWHLWWITPYTPFWSVEVKATKNNNSDNLLRILTVNVLTPNRDAELLLSHVRQYKPDVLVTLESDDWWQSQLGVLESEMSYSIKCPLDNLYGMHVYSRLELEEAEIKFLVEDDIPSMHSLLRLRSGDKVRMHFLHPTPPSPTENPESAERDAELVIVARSVADSDQPIVVTGDLNDVAWSPTTRLFRRLSGLLDPRVGRGMFNTFHADYPFLRWPLDHIFHSHHFTVHTIQRLTSIGSDHFPLFTVLSFTPAQGSTQEGLDKDSSSQSFANEVVDEKSVSESDVPRPGES